MIKPPTRPGPHDGHHSTQQVADLLEVTTIRLHRLIKDGHIEPAVPAAGPGTVVRWSDENVAEARRIIARIDWGMTPAAAARTIDPPLPGTEVA